MKWAKNALSSSFYINFPPPCPLHKPFHPCTHTSKSLHPNPKMSASIPESSAQIHETTLMIDGLSSLIDETTLMICLWMQVFASLRSDIWEFGSRRNRE